MIGAGLAGSLLAILLSQRGWQVTLFERRGDPRIKGYESGRSINLALAERGRHALRQAGAEDAVMSRAVMMRGRMVHALGEAPQLQRYGRDDSEVIWSIHRADLNIALLDLAEAAGAKIQFYRRLHTVDFPAGYARFIDDRDDSPHDIRFDTLIGADGAGSALRAAMDRACPLGARTEFLGHSYKELEIPPAEDGGFRIEPNALHLWPRGDYMCIALPNDEGTFTVTLFLPNEGPTSFATVASGAQARALFERDFPDALPLIPDLVHDWEAHPPGLLGTLYLDRWHLGGRAVLLGDAAHAMVPFHGQGMNCAFEDCVALAEQLDRADSLAQAYAAFEAQRKPNAAAIQAMALENYIEMRDRVDDADFLLQRQLEQALQQRHPDRFVPHYTMVTFMRIPYAVALERSELQRQLLIEATAGRRALAQVDWDWVDAQVRARLSVLTDSA
ncbi:FAD-dependent monooxygenase [Pseudoxanthomonas winnipegensis]|uniref:Kynurenine 3-monooxygenase n=1 Tax=Pseudoxanthomonas winnipegensis TaxID=2480810 RepID=A0A4Q8LK73_9GAMM|nr:FAD-dependent monooxygenase [Pseudoxanthomonas winnipegensis]TAA30112.1 FAD-dependent monooxygenase [Pseudoxanthomonas winnipegensis]TAA40763.1 FAD-dependent monooxygenase [Pseudoxanthomonas winnipegensis]TBV78239.1 FAD-dependent monooxygenase [Pseudoxanthomonas winnipegensis]